MLQYGKEHYISFYCLLLLFISQDGLVSQDSFACA